MLPNKATTNQKSAGLNSPVSQSSQSSSESPSLNSPVSPVQSRVAWSQQSSQSVQSRLVTTVQSVSPESAGLNSPVSPVSPVQSQLVSTVQSVQSEPFLTVQSVEKELQREYQKKQKANREQTKATNDSNR